MAITTPSMGLKRWDQPNDIFSYVELSDNFALLDNHDHSSGKGVQIPTAGIANLAITDTKIATNAVTNGKIINDAVDSSKIAALAVGTSELQDVSVTLAKLASSSVSPAKLALPACRLTMTGNQSITNSVTTAISFNSEKYNTGGSAMHSTSVNPTRLIAPTTGLYLIIGGVEWNTSATGIRDIVIRTNGTTEQAARRDSGIASFTIPQQCMTLMQMTAGDYAEIMLTQTSGGALLALSALRGDTYFIQLG